MPKSINQPPGVAGARLPIERVRDIKFAKRLRQLMSERDMSQSDLAAEIWGRQGQRANLSPGAVTGFRCGAPVKIFPTGRT